MVYTLSLNKCTQHWKAVEHQHPRLPKVTIPPNGHFMVGGRALAGGHADQAAGAAPPAALACGSDFPKKSVERQPLKSLEGLCLGTTLPRLPARLHRQRLHVAVTFLTKQWSASMPACQRSQCRHMDLLEVFGEALFRNNAAQAASAAPPAALDVAVTFLTKQWSASVPACQRSQCHHMDLLKPLEGSFWRQC